MTNWHTWVSYPLYVPTIFRVKFNHFIKKKSGTLNVWTLTLIATFLASRSVDYCPHKLDLPASAQNNSQQCSKNTAGLFFPHWALCFSLLLRISAASNISNIHQWMIHSVEYLSDRRSLSQKIFNLHSGLAVVPAQEQKQHEGVDDKPRSPAAVP